MKLIDFYENSKGMVEFEKYKIDKNFFLAKKTKIKNAKLLIDMLTESLLQES